jgi:predicted O-methyltransferase YrrM
VNCDEFVARIDELFDGPVADGRPRDGRFDAVAADVPGFTTPAELAVLNLAARLLPEGEAYLEVGTFKGRSIAGAVIDAPDREFVAVENFSEFGMVGVDARRTLEKTVSEYASGRRFTLHDADCFELLARPGVLDEPVGVYFYDGAHTGLARFLALGVVEPLLADEALVLVDDATWPMVSTATLRYSSSHDGWSVLRDIRAETDHDERWANGLLILRYRRPAGSDRRMAADIRWRRLVQTRLRGPATLVIWKTLHRFPGLVPLAKTLVRKGPRQVPGQQA